VTVYPYSENFDQASQPLLPPGWGSTKNRGVEPADMIISQSAPHSAPCCVSATNAMVAQALISPEFDFTAVVPGSINCFMRRSSTFSAPVVLECSTDGGGLWGTPLGDTLLPDGSTNYVECERDLPRSLSGLPHVRIRWRVIPATAGSSGTLRFDDVSVTVHAAYDLSLASLRVTPASPRSTDPVEVTGIVKNVGYAPASGFSLCLYRNCGDTAHPVPCDPIAVSGASGVLNPGDSASITLSGLRLAGGINELVGVVKDTSDTNQSDNLLPIQVDVTSVAGAVVINEIMFAPFTGEGEYIELLNRSDQPTSLTGWQLTAGSTTSSAPKRLVIPRFRAPLSPGECAVVAEDSGLFRFFPPLLGPDSGRVVIPSIWETRLNNVGGYIVLSDSRGSFVDSVCYSPTWHNPSVIDRTGRSLERILASGPSNDPANWTTCALPAGGTPARKNSVSITGQPQGGTLSCFPNPFSPDGDGVEDATVIRYHIPQGVWSVTLRIFDARGRAVRTLATCDPATGDGEYIWDGRDQEHLVARMGIYVILLEARDSRRLLSFSEKGVVVLAHRLR
jgi:hypothetical protein